MRLQKRMKLTIISLNKEASSAKISAKSFSSSDEVGTFEKGSRDCKLST
ncbi:MAG: hypothetical protein WBQ25_10270 [Nitrososphaeraceae archaeon]